MYLCKQYCICTGVNGTLWYLSQVYMYNNPLLCNNLLIHVHLELCSTWMTISWPQARQWVLAKPLIWWRSVCDVGTKHERMWHVLNTRGATTSVDHWVYVISPHCPPPFFTILPTFLRMKNPVIKSHLVKTCTFIQQWYYGRPWYNYGYSLCNNNVYTYMK